MTKELKLPKDRLYVSVFKDDDEAAQIWEKQEGVPKDRISRFGGKHKLLVMGRHGPLRALQRALHRPLGAMVAGKPRKVGRDCHRYMEFWNLVFMQFERDASGKLTPLPKPSVDTGAGLERIAAILQEVDTNYDTDGFLHIISQTAKLAGRPYDKNSPLAVSFRVVADHARATTFLIGDGVLLPTETPGLRPSPNHALQ